jgi:hypothetical protein
MYASYTFKLVPNPIHKMQLKHHITTNLRNLTPPKNVPVHNSCTQPHGTTNSYYNHTFVKAIKCAEV